ncbi:unnamed protein product, partial [Vitis vinifera]|uniref:Uncharacterized protein n=1 Tax=Vitis vinifera TaxID=29760 RepID=D7SHK1_VITVI
MENSREKKKNFFTETVVGAGERQALGNDTGGEDDGISQDGLRIGEDFEVSGGKIDLGDSFNEDLSVEWRDWARQRSMISLPLIPSVKPGKFSTSILRMDAYGVQFVYNEK